MKKTSYKYDDERKKEEENNTNSDLAIGHNEW